MDFEEACNILNVQKGYTKESLKKAYYKKALSSHPDKGGSDEKFKKVVSAYEHLIRHSGLKENLYHNESYSSLLKKAVNWFDPSGSLDEEFIRTSFKNILLHCENASIEIFKKLSIEKSIKFLDIITKYESVFQLKKQTVLKMHEILQEKLNDNIIVLEVLLEDVFNDKIYKYELEDDVYYIPLWHKYYYLTDNNNRKITTLRLCRDKDDYKFCIKENNDIYFKIFVKLQKLFDQGYYNFVVGEFSHKIYACELKIKKEQMYIIKNKGISKVNKTNLYDTSTRGDIYLEITLI